MIVGTIVKLKKECSGNPRNAKGVCYKIYSRGKGKEGVAILFENGKLERFSSQEQNGILIPIGTSEDLMNYQFENIGKVYEDFRNGFFNSVFKGNSIAKR